MKYIISFIMIVLFIGCGGSDKTTTQTPQSLSTNSVPPNTQETQTAKPVQTIHNTPKKLTRTVTIYIHGYSKSGYKKEGVFGDDNYDTIIDTIIEMTGFDSTLSYEENSTNLIAITPYYGNNSPAYYTAKDEQDLEAIGDGIPRYALIIAKFARHIMIETKADKVNFLSVSMGSLVTRYLIEKDLEQLASEKKISRWLSLEGVIKGNIAASADNLLSLVNEFEKQSPDVAQMDYDWIKDNLDIKSPYYHDMQIGFESSTHDNASKALLSWWMRSNQHFEPNDGVQAVKDTFFASDVAHTFFYNNHYTLADNQAAWGYAATFLTSTKRVRLTLLDATLSDLHEDNIPFLHIKPADIVFESSVHSTKAEEKWGFTKAIDERLLKGKYLPLYAYHDRDISQTLNQTLFDSYILEDENTLSLTLTPYELDREPDYGVREITGHGEHESLGTTTIMIPVKEGIYPLQGRDWSGRVKVEIF